MRHNRRERRVHDARAELQSDPSRALSLKLKNGRRHIAKVGFRLHRRSGTGRVRPNALLPRTAALRVRIQPVDATDW